MPAPSSKELIAGLARIVGSARVLTEAAAQAPYTRGFRVGHGPASAVALPQSLLELWQVLETCVGHDAIMLMQAANTGVTGGSTPAGADYDRPLVIISTRDLQGVQLLDEARQVLAFPGTTLTQLEAALKPYGREPHSVIGSSCIGASVIGGICNNSGGSLLRRGPAFTEKSLFAQVDAQGRLQLVNHLGIDLGEDPVTILERLAGQDYRIGDQPDWEGRIWASDYAAKLREVDAARPARFNGDPAYLHDSAGSSGKLAVFAVRLPSFPASEASITYYLGAHDEAVFIALRRRLLRRLEPLPIQAEYIHRQAFALTVRYAKHLYKAIARLGTERIPALFAAKNRWQQRLKRFLPWLPAHSLDAAIQGLNAITSSGVAPRIMDFHRRYEHHLLIKTEAAAGPALEAELAMFFASAPGGYFSCTGAEEKNAFLIRFGVGASTVYYCESKAIDRNQRLISFDVALRANDDQWRLQLPLELQAQVLTESCCGHFFCFVNHQDYILKPGSDGAQFKTAVLAYLDRRGAKYPAEHNIGHVYHAAPDYQAFLRELDPTNSFNPGLGHSSKNKHWA